MTVYILIFINVTEPKQNHYEYLNYMNRTGYNIVLINHSDLTNNTQSGGNMESNGLLIYYEAYVLPIAHSHDIYTIQLVD